jgi:DNA-binding transcriptional MerR regulator
VKISQLAQRSNVPVATIKFYLREKLLHDGALTSPTQAQYDETHMQRLALVRALLGPAGLSVAATRELLSRIEAPPEGQHDLLGVAHNALNPPAPDDVDLARVQELMQRWGWQIDEKDRDSQAALATALKGLEAAGFQLPDGILDVYARSMAEVAEVEIANTPLDSAEAAVRYVILGTVLVEPLILALRRLAEQDASGRRFGSASSTGRTDRE